jgi:hypothetical protein
MVHGSDGRLNNFLLQQGDYATNAMRFEPLPF